MSETYDIMCFRKNGFGPVSSRHEKLDDAITEAIKTHNRHMGQLAIEIYQGDKFVWRVPKQTQEDRR